MVSTTSVSSQPVTNIVPLRRRWALTTTTAMNASASSPLTSARTNTSAISGPMTAGRYLAADGATRSHRHTSGWRDLNSRPLVPQTSALTKLRYSPYDEQRAYRAARRSGEELDDPPREVQRQQDDEHLEVPRRLGRVLLAILAGGQLLEVDVLRRDPLCRRLLQCPPARRARAVRVHRRRREVAGAVLAPGHGGYSVRLRTRSFSGVAPKSNASRMLRSRNRRYGCGSSRLTNRVNVGGSVAPCNAYSTRAPPPAGWRCWASAMTRLASRVGTRRWYCSIASCSAGRSLCTPVPVRAEIFSTGASPTKYSLRFSSACTSRRRSASSISSHLLSITTIGHPAASTRSARRWSWLVMPSVASMTRRAMSAPSIARRARTSE